MVRFHSQLSGRGRSALYAFWSVGATEDPVIPNLSLENPPTGGPSTRGETVTLSDAQSANAVFAAARAESIALSDAQSASLTFSAACAESVALNDTQSASTVFSATRAEALALADAQTGAVVGSSVSQTDELVSLADSQSAIWVQHPASLPGGIFPEDGGPTPTRPAFRRTYARGWLQLFTSRPPGDTPGGAPPVQ